MVGVIDVETGRNLSFIVCGSVRWLERYGNVAHGGRKNRNEVLHGKRGMEPRKIFEKCIDWQCEIAKVELERKNSLRGSVRERDEVCENGEDGNNNLSEHVVTLFFDGACDSTAGMAGLGAIIMSGSGNQLGTLAFPLTGVLKPHIIEALTLWFCMLNDESSDGKRRLISVVVIDALGSHVVLQSTAFSSESDNGDADVVVDLENLLLVRRELGVGLVDACHDHVGLRSEANCHRALLHVLHGLVDLEELTAWLIDCRAIRLN
ncbi:hypothetical protein ACLB2K_065495 [Fragaria x ananassa]